MTHNISIETDRWNIRCTHKLPVYLDSANKHTGTSAYKVRTLIPACHRNILKLTLEMNLSTTQHLSVYHENMLTRLVITHVVPSNTLPTQ